MVAQKSHVRPLVSYVVLTSLFFAIGIVYGINRASGHWLELASAFLFAFLPMAVAAGLSAFAIGRRLARQNQSHDEALKSCVQDFEKDAQSVEQQSTSIADSSNTQAAALQETISAVDEIRAMVDKNTEAAQKSKEVSTQSRRAAENGRKQVESMILSIREIGQSNDDISNQMTKSNQQLSDITRMISEIAAKTNVINDIVFQTKLLSFNASVEAARAGEYGKGFSVVAEEVGNLAQMSGNAAKEISQMLSRSTEQVQAIVDDNRSRVDLLINSSRSKVNNGSDRATECNSALEEILDNVSSVDELVSEIAIASTEQSTGIREISRAIGQMEETVQKTKSISQSLATTGKAIRGQCQNLKSIVQSASTHDSLSLSRHIGSSQAGKAKNSAKATKPVMVETVKSKQASAKSLPKPPAKSNKQSHGKPNSQPFKIEPNEQAHTEQQSIAQSAGAEFIPTANDPGFDESGAA